ncbi:MAG: rod shape-determining protein RodA [Lachnospiraceae bacterium]|nr:rod shape-determining protein RodA [Lachnospiraceae bacterium]
MFQKYHIRYYNFRLLIFTIALAVIGVLAVGSADESLQSRQLWGVVAGAFLMLILSVFDYSIILKLYWAIYIVNAILLVAVIFFGEEANNAQRWLKILGIQFQPSELAKLLIILFFAAFINRFEEQFNSLLCVLASFILFAVPAVLVFKQPDLSTTMVICVIFASIMVIGNLSIKTIAGILAVVLPVFAILIYLIMQPDQKILSEYQKNRLFSFFNKEATANDIGYQQTYSEMAIGSGQLLGKGYRNNEIYSVKNADFIAEQQTDFIFAVIGEEFGFVGCSTVIILIFLITIECFRTALRAKDMAGRIIAAGVGTHIGFQSFINIGVVTFLLPNTGLPLPFVSYGLTSLIASFLEIGFVLNVGLQYKQVVDRSVQSSGFDFDL